MDVKKLIEEVILSLGDNEDFELVKNKIQIISRLLKNKDFSKWVNNEFIFGYNSTDALPNYRILKLLEIQADFIMPCCGGVMKYTKHRVPIENLGTDKFNKISSCKIIDSVPILQDLLKKNGKLCVGLTPNELYDVQDVLSGCQIMQAYKVLGYSQLRNIINYAKGRLIDIFIDFNNTLFNGDLDISKKGKEISQIIINAGIVQTGNGNLKLINSNSLGGENNTSNI